MPDHQLSVTMPFSVRPECIMKVELKGYEDNIIKLVYRVENEKGDRLLFIQRKSTSKKGTVGEVKRKAIKSLISSMALTSGSHQSYACPPKRITAYMLSQRTGHQ